jgi:hypothetical protein
LSTYYFYFNFKIKKLLSTLKKLRLLNLSSNKLNTFSKLNDSEEKINDDDENDDDEQVSIETNLKSAIDYFNSEWQPVPTSLNKCSHLYDNLTTLILNSCFIDLRIIECLLDRLACLTELHLASNNYKTVNFNKSFRKSSLKILYFNNNLIKSWPEICKLGRCFPNLENLVISENNISTLDEPPGEQHNQSNSSAVVFKNLSLLIINKLKINDWSSIDHLRKFPSLRHVRIQNIPLLESLSDDEKYFVLVGHLDNNIHSLNGSHITLDDKEHCERKYLRYFMDCENKPTRYYELESKHGKLDKLIDVSLEISRKVNVKIKYNGKHVYDKIDVRQTVGDFKKYLEKYVGVPSNRFKVFYIDIEAFSMAVYGPEELKHTNRCLYSFNIRDHDEFEIDLKPVPLASSSSMAMANGGALAQQSQNILHSTHSESQLPYHHLHHLHFHHYNSHLNNNSQYQAPYFANTPPMATTTTTTTASKPILIKSNKKVFDSSCNLNSKKATTAACINNSTHANANSSTANSNSAAATAAAAASSSNRVRLSSKKVKPGLGGGLIASKNERIKKEQCTECNSSSSSSSKSSSSSLPANLNCFKGENKIPTVEKG